MIYKEISLTCDPIFILYSLSDPPHQGKHFDSCFIKIGHFYTKLTFIIRYLSIDKILFLFFMIYEEISLTCVPIFAFYSSSDSPHRGEHFGSCFIKIGHLYTKLMFIIRYLSIDKFYSYFS